MPADFDARMRDHMRSIMQRSSMKGKLGIRADVDEEVLTLSKVTVDSAASESGLMIGDVLLQVNGRDITSMETLRRALAGGLRGEEVSMIVTRDGVKKTFKATLK
jgi:S1-C subfamily serine protease